MPGSPDPVDHILYLAGQVLQDYGGDDAGVNTRIARLAAWIVYNLGAVDEDPRVSVENGLITVDRTSYTGISARRLGAQLLRAAEGL